MNKNLIGVTEHCDPTVDLSWLEWVKNRPAIIISKNPGKLLPLINPNMNIIIHCTITGLGHSVYEPNIPPYEDSLRAYHYICDLMGKERVVLRIDPIIDTLGLDYARTLNQLKREAESRVRISFLDLYPHVIQRFKNKGIELKRTVFHMPLEQRINIWNTLGKPEVCGEPDMIVTPCVSELDCQILGVSPNDKTKDQRFTCACLANKRELLKAKCTYNCLYCYWK